MARDDQPPSTAQGLLRDQIAQFLDRYGDALAAGDLATVVACWEVPALVLSDGGAVAVSAESQIESFFGQAVEAYRAQGLVATEPEIIRLEQVTPRVIGVDVRWSNLDASGAEKGLEATRYVLRTDDHGRPRIRATIALETPQGRPA